MILKIYLYQFRIILYFNFEMNWLILGKISLFPQKKYGLKFIFFQNFE
jgi:hypothetical protein